VTVLTALTWLAVVVLSAGSIGVFIFFLRDIPGVLPGKTDDGTIDGSQPKT
jgi:hypothetical protein